MPSKSRKSNQRNTDAPQERVPLQPDTDEIDVNEESSINPTQIHIAPLWREIYEESAVFDPYDEEQYPKSIFFETDNDELFAPLIDGFSYCSISEYFDEHQTAQIISPLTVENVSESGIINFVSYDNISFANQLASIYEFVIQLLHSMDYDNAANIIYPWNLIFPQNKKTLLPVLSTNGLYFVKLFIGGNWRSILINDKVPLFDEKWLFPDIAESNDLWPQLLSKAILKYLILSKRLNDPLCVPLIAQLLTSKVVTMNISPQISTDCGISYEYITKSVKDTEESKIDIDQEETWPIIVTEIEDWSSTQTKDAPNKFMINDEINQTQNESLNWVIIKCPEYNATETVNDLWKNTKTFCNDLTAMIVTVDEAKEISDTDTFDIILQIDSLDANLSERVQLFVYDQANNIKKLIQMNHMQNGFVSFVAPIIPKQIYLIEVDNNVSYSVAAYWNPQCCNLQIAPRFGDKLIWNSVGYNMMEIAMESKPHPISQTFVLFNIQLTVQNWKCDILFHGVFDDEALSNSLIFYCVNLDNNCMELIPNLNLSKVSLEQNQNGYSLIAFSRPTQALNSSKYEIKLLYRGEIEQNIIDMRSSLDFRIDYVHNYDVVLMKDEIISDKTSDGNCVFMFCELYFVTNNDEYGEFGKIIEFIDKDTEDIVAKYTSTQQIVYVPQIMIDNQHSKLWFAVKLDKNNAGLSATKLFTDNSVQCMVRIISNASVHLFPDNSKQTQFNQIKQSWDVSKGRAEKASETRQKYLQNQSNKNSTSFGMHETQNKDGVVVNDEFWTKDSEIKNQLLQKSAQSIENEQQFRADQTAKINDHNTYIAEVQTESFQTTQTFTKNDANQRDELRLERLKWNQILSELDTVDGEMKENFDHFTKMLIKYHEDINEVIQNEIDSAAEPAKKGKSKSKSKLTKPNANNVIFPSDASKVIENCNNIEQNVPQWMYANKIDDCNAKICSILYQAYQRINVQFSEFVKRLKTIQNLENDAFNEANEKYIDLSTAIFEQMDAVKKWKNCIIWDDKLRDAQKKSDNIMMDSVFVKLQNVISKEAAIDICKQEDTEVENENEPKEINVDTMKQYLNEIPFVSETRTEIIIKQRTFGLDESYREYIRNIKQWIEQHTQQNVEQ